MAEDEFGSADLERIKRMIPHRDPFLLIDRVERIKKGESAVGVKALTGDEPWFAGHFPGEPVMPGVLIVEALAQTAGVLVVDTLGKIDEKLLVYFMTVDKTRFRKLVKPGDTLEFHATILRGRGKVWKFYGEAKVDGEVAAQAEYSAMIIEPGDPRRAGPGRAPASEAAQ
jgi:3-hydroxyacyl-[acyl-carrier-protein] dehydratase